MKNKHPFLFFALISAFVIGGCSKTNHSSIIPSSITPQSETSLISSNEPITSSVSINSDEPSSNVVPSSTPASSVIPSSAPVSSVAPSSNKPSSSSVTPSSAPVSSSASSQSSEESKSAWTIMIYMCGSDLESQDGLASEDIKEILSVKNQPDDVNIIIETGGSTKWKSYNISNKKLSRYHVANNKLVLDESLKNASMGKQNTFESFLTWGLESYPAEKTGLIIWNHGGALLGACSDDNFNGDYLQNSEAKAAFKNVLGNQKLEFIGYDCCLMQVQDIASFNAPYFNYMIASEESEVGEGWAYNGFIENVYAKKDTDTILKTICDDFIASIDETYGEDYNDQTISYLDLSKMASYKTAFEDLALSLKNDIKTSSFNNYVLENVYSYGNDWVTKSDYEYYIENGYYTTDMFDPNPEVFDGVTYYYLFGIYDFGSCDVLDFLTKIKTFYLNSDVENKINYVISLLDEVVVYNNTGTYSKDSGGLALIFPADEYVAEYVYLSSETDFTNWHGAVTDSNRVY